jgi:ADP-heptose:LPS heptosyltransferase
MSELQTILGRLPTPAEIHLFDTDEVFRLGLQSRKVVRPLAIPFVPAIQEKENPADVKVINLEMQANGIGDALLGLHAVAGARVKYPNAVITYHCKNQDWVSLFKAGYDQLLPLGKQPGSRNLNAEYHLECRSQCKRETRVERYCRNAGDVLPGNPELRYRDSVLAEGAAFAGVVSLCIKSHYNNRNYPVAHWLELERLLHAQGHRTAIIHHNAGDMLGFRGTKCHGKTARQIAAILLNSEIVVGCDTGTTHLAALLGKKPFVLSGPCLASRVYHMPIVEVIGEGGYNGEKCAGCFWQKQYAKCNADKVGCASLKSIGPQQIMEMIKARE